MLVKSLTLSLILSTFGVADAMYSLAQIKNMSKSKPTTTPTSTSSITKLPAVPTSVPSGAPLSKPIVLPPVAPPASATPTTKPPVKPLATPSFKPLVLTPAAPPTTTPTVVPSFMPAIAPAVAPSTIAQTFDPFDVPSFVPSIGPNVAPVSKPIKTTPSSSVPSTAPKSDGAPISDPNASLFDMLSAPSARSSLRPVSQHTGTPVSKATPLQSFKFALKPTPKPTVAPFSQPTALLKFTTATTASDAPLPAPAKPKLNETRDIPLDVSKGVISSPPAPVKLPSVSPTLVKSPPVSIHPTSVPAKPDSPTSIKTTSTFPVTSTSTVKTPIRVLPSVPKKEGTRVKIEEFFKSGECGESDCFENLFSAGIIKNEDDFTVMTDFLRSQKDLLDKLMKSMPYKISETGEIIMDEERMKFYSGKDKDDMHVIINPKYEFFVALLLTFEGTNVVKSLNEITSFKSHKPNWISKPFPGGVFKYINAKTELSNQLVNLIASKNRWYSNDNTITYEPFASQVGLTLVNRLMEEGTTAALDILFEYLKIIRTNSNQTIALCLREVLKRATDQTAWIVYKLFNYLVEARVIKNYVSGKSSYEFKEPDALNSWEYGAAIHKAIKNSQFNLAKVLLKGASKKDFYSAISAFAAEQDYVPPSGIDKITSDLVQDFPEERPVIKESYQKIVGEPSGTFISMMPTLRKTDVAPLKTSSPTPSAKVLSLEPKMPKADNSVKPTTSSVPKVSPKPIPTTLHTSVPATSSPTSVPTTFTKPTSSTTQVKRSPLMRSITPLKEIREEIFKTMFVPSKCDYFMTALNQHMESDRVGVLALINELKGDKGFSTKQFGKKLETDLFGKKD